jgi:Big-like domain-containing protein
MARALEMAGAIYKNDVDIHVLPVKVAVSSPLTNSTVTSPVHVHASVQSASTVFTIQIYVDNALNPQNGKAIDAHLPGIGAALRGSAGLG